MPAFDEKDFEAWYAAFLAAFKQKVGDTRWTGYLCPLVWLDRIENGRPICKDAGYRLFTVVKD